MGAPKPLLPVQGRPAVMRCLESLHNAGVAEIVLVVNPEGGDIVTAAKDIPARVAVNERPDSDMAASVKAGLALVDRAATVFMISLRPPRLIRSDTLEPITSPFSCTPGAIIIPVYRGRKGHPTLFPRLDLEDPGTHATLRDVIRRHRAKISLLDVEDEGVILDMDTPEDYLKIIERYGP
jgi:CTP:molybdopterin cytidylyltransferase MocA